LQVLTVVVTMLWIIVAAGTTKGAYSGKLFYAPCLENLKPEKQAADGGEKAA